MFMVSILAHSCEIDHAHNIVVYDAHTVRQYGLYSGAPTP